MSLFVVRVDKPADHLQLPTYMMIHACVIYDDANNYWHAHMHAGQEVICYESPRPTMGIHRFVLVLFQQLVRQTVYAPGWRQNFNTRDFAELYNLGPPVAAVYFNCQREAGSGGRRTYS